MHDKELQEILDKIKEYAPNTDTTLVEKAYYLAKSAHDGVLRKSGEPYIIHPIAVANILVEMQLDIETISAGLLHDVIEDTDYTYDDIKEMFSKEVADLVDGVTKLGQIKYQSKEETQAENLRKMFLAMAKDIRVILIKLADRLHNMRTLKYMPEEKAKYKAKETLEIYGGIAHRLGISKIKWELEDLALRYIDPDGYYDLVDKVSMKRSQREEYISRIVNLLQEKFGEVNIDCEVYGRPKHFYSIYRKMKNKHKTFEEIFDLTAVRIVVDTIKDCYAVLGMVHTLWVPMPGRFKDYIAMPKANMYQSLHTTVIGPEGEPVEIQIRTHEMHNIAEYGIAAHWKYKEGTMSNDEKMEEKLKWLRQMMEWEKDVKDPQEFLDSLKEDVFNSQVYVFTPKGDVIELPAESTPIDFAYRVHSKVGNKCVGAKINGRLVPIDYTLQNGEIVEVITSTNSNGPSRDWLKIVKTPNARNRIRQFFKKERREENIERGYEILEKEFKRYGIPLKDSSVEKFMEQISKKFNQPSLEDLIATIGYGGIMASQVVPKVRDFYLKEEKKKEKENRQKENEDLSKYNITDKEYKEKRKKSSSGVIVRGLDNILVRFAKCCNPLPGDEIVGYVTKGRGVAIHRADCPNCKLDDELFQKRLVDVEWNNPKKSKFEGEVKIVATDRKSMLSDVTHMIAIQKLNINGINARKTKEGITHINLLIEVNDISELTNLMKKLKAIPGVEDVFRVRN
ncbi:MAG: bifunctional (p)ppGpp synthetase/guanosine-3',5'-bis(diphosphate) 3'-pyrophosphohydrolase [Terrisporobacter othiniensis]|uniref:GTP diphosphokinase n=2 Tax=Terrisporobacter TaxID=1505652 RepID=A0AAX2ZAF1_9FIRM|nr:MULTISPECIES: bifunctional (p)ppGpp synthetase/guanosine-3',5'-bis(diphosphate) 3'-pyrophosphohydrolase [Terrisporobacter]MBN9648465.1 bifunctional (p)ppGpp synthetase/guanosine-3',5'-bis(diphosphate) 3'-pyrophosphohydrolase [Terrisporobacter glycolicus]MDU4861377.1 bifunctional (p)ppGpp synthetase/guanosine-3',5'-bis(diphosphate) 3'-pyrophosphohydrolase [Terrisporobacter othiniensis]MDU6994674.1 bifunctional (p)ppGpp synthetase/guanosine-3',5'-bis(diphosphate) 3'-pyrophosphohydrolase [Terris